MSLLMLKLLDYFNDPFRLAVGLRILDLRKGLFNAALPTKFYRRHDGSDLPDTPFCCPCNTFGNRIGTFLQDLFQESLGRVLDLVWKERCAEIRGNNHRSPQTSTLGARRLIQPSTEATTS